MTHVPVEGRLRSGSRPPNEVPFVLVRAPTPLPARRHARNSQLTLPADAREQMSANMPAGYVDAFFSFFVDGTYDDSHVYPTVQQLLGRPPRNFEQWAHAHADAFR